MSEAEDFDDITRDLSDVAEAVDMYAFVDVSQIPIITNCVINVGEVNIRFDCTCENEDHGSTDRIETIMLITFIKSEDDRENPINIVVPIRSVLGEALLDAGAGGFAAVVAQKLKEFEQHS